MSVMHKPLHPGVLVKDEIDATGLTVTQAAEKLGVSRTALSRLMHEHMGISPEMALRLAKLLGPVLTGKDLKSICMIASERVIKNKVEKQKRYYISSTAALAQKHLKYSREHWQIENNLHGVLDVIFREDQATLAQRAAHNVAVIRKLILNMIKRYKTATGEKIAIKSVRKMACWSTNVAADIIKYWVVN